MVRQGFGVILVDSRACAKPPAMVTLGVQELQVIETALEFLMSQPDVSNIGIIGFSWVG